MSPSFLGERALQGLLAYMLDVGSLRMPLGRRLPSHYYTRMLTTYNA